MKLTTFIAYATLGYVAMMKLAPILQAKLEAANLDDAWDVFDE